MRKLTKNQFLKLLKLVRLGGRWIIYDHKFKKTFQSLKSKGFVELKISYKSSGTIVGDLKYYLDNKLEIKITEEGLKYLIDNYRHHSVFNNEEILAEKISEIENLYINYGTI